MKDLPFDPMDPQRDPVYEAELEVFPRDKDKFLSLVELQAEADRILALPWFINAYGMMEIAIKDGRGAKWSRAGGDEIHLLRVSRVKDVLVHEIIHNVVPPGAEWHGTAFCGTLLYFIGKLYGLPTKTKLRRTFKRRNVVWDKRLARFGNPNRAGKEGEV